MGGEGCPRVLVQAVSRSLSQSGMANLERACGGPQVIISGGEQRLQYDLVSISESPVIWEVHAAMRKELFESFVIIDEACDGEMGSVTVLQCSADSFISRSCVLRFTLKGEGEVLVDACGLVNEIHLVDDNGQPLQLPEQKPLACADTKERIRFRDTLRENLKNTIVHVVSNFSLRPVITRCSNCRKRAKDRRERNRDRRNRAAAATEPDGISLTAPDTALSSLNASLSNDNADSGLRTPLTDSPV